MDQATAEARLKRLTAWNVTPVIGQDVIDDLLAQAQRPDAAGRVPSDPAWAYTVDLNWAAWKGWEEKLSQASGAYDIATMGKTFGRGTLFDHCKEQVASYRRKVNPASIGVESRYR